GRCVVAHEDKKTGGFGGEIASAIGEELFRYLDAPVARVGSKDTPVGFAKSLEQAILLSVSDIAEAVRTTMRF
ncbi:MAG: transketolase C-terminal domain-containing protein, partial [Bacteroidota bacterium]